jgi:hypothetical protein
MTGDRADDRHLLRAASVGRASVEDVRAKESFSVDIKDIMDISIGHYRSAQLKSSREPGGVSLKGTRKAQMPKFRCSIP